MKAEEAVLWTMEKGKVEMSVLRLMTQEAVATRTRLTELTVFWTRKGNSLLYPAVTRCISILAAIICSFGSRHGIGG